MFRVVSLLVLVGSSLADIRGSSPKSIQLEDVDGVMSNTSVFFHKWMKEHEKFYETTEEKSKRILIWAKNHQLIEKHNNQLPPPNFVLGHNHFSDLTNDEYQAVNKLDVNSPGISYGDNMPKIEAVEEDEESMSRILKDLPKEVNWVEKGAVTSVKNQKKCGACWAFSAVAAMEGALQIKTGKLVNLSEQQLVDCDTAKEKGCSGGMMDTAFQYEMSKGGLCKYDDYPYVAKKGTCGKCDIVEGTHVTSFVDATKSEAGLMLAISIQPTAVAIKASQLFFQFYKSGVFDHLCFPKVNHGVLAAGYGTDEKSGLDYWLVKNSWSDKWGDKGYIKIARKSYSKLGRCGIHQLASRPVLAA